MKERGGENHQVPGKKKRLKPNEATPKSFLPDSERHTFNISHVPNLAAGKKDEGKMHPIRDSELPEDRGSKNAPGTNSIRESASGLFKENAPIPIIRTSDSCETEDREHIKPSAISPFEIHTAGNPYENNRFDRLILPWYALQEGDMVMRNKFWLQPSKGEPTDKEIQLHIHGEKLTLFHQQVETDLILVEPLIKEGMERWIGHARRTADGQEIAIRNSF